MMHETASHCSLDNPVRQLELIRPSFLSWRKLWLRFRWALLLLSALLPFSMGRLAIAVQKGEQILRAKTIEAEKFVLLGPDGEQAAVLVTQSDKEPRLSFHDLHGVRRLTVGFNAQYEPSISFYGERHDHRMDLDSGAAPDLTGVSMLDEASNLQIIVGVNHLEPAIFVGRVPDHTYIALHKSDDLGPTVRLSDGKGKGRMRLSVRGNFGSVVELLNQDLMDRLSWRVLGDGSPVLTSTDGASKVRLQISTDADGNSSVRFLDPNGIVAREVTDINGR